MLKNLTFLFLCVAIAFSKPMESLANYNVILVHGAADKWGGLDCADDAEIEEPYNVIINNRYNYTKRIGGFVKDGEKQPSATGMIKELAPWLRDKVFDHDTLSVYFQRPFVNPAGSPIENGKEIGLSQWQGDGDKCNKRRSLIEEAQEVRANGRTNLASLRQNVENRDELPPSRNILIAHSMGGVASREYVQGSDYNDDVDKVITLDSPHEGTGSLNLLLDMKDYDLRGVKSVTSGVLVSAFWLATSRDLSNIKAGLYGFATSTLATTVNTLFGNFILGYLEGFDYKSDDPLVNYIDPNHLYSSTDGIGNLKNRPYKDNLPMIRLLGGKNSMTFTDPNENWRGPLSIFIPNAFTAAFANVLVHAAGNETTAANVVNSFTGFTAGLLVGITVQEHGTALVPKWSSLAESTDALDGLKADVRRQQYDAAINANDDAGLVSIATNFAVLGASIWAVDIALHMVFPEAAKAAKIAMATIGTLALGGSFVLLVNTGFEDLKLSHEAPVRSEYQSKWKGNENTYSKISGGQDSYEPYRMEEFLYEKPFANIRVISNYDSQWQDKKMDSLGLYVKKTFYDTTYAEGQENITETIKSVPIYIADRLSGSNPLNFKSPSDWETMGAKKVRWTKTAGVEDSIPIRHADRYPMPAMPVDEFIYKYEFEIDDLMPHRLRQIRLSFNYNEEIAWECDINKSETADDACIVYKRGSNGQGWKPIDTVKHPVTKDGIFDMHKEQTRFKRNLAIFLS